MITDTYNRGRHSSCVFVDYTKAFETLDHTILLQKLIHYNINNDAIAWINSYLGNRRHTVKCNDICSTPFRVKYGVPQGSVLGPHCLIMYVNDLISHILQNTTAYIVMYADDTVLLTEGAHPQEAVNTMQEVLQVTSTWCKRNKLTVNANKNKHMLVLRNKELANETGPLGVDIDGLFCLMYCLISTWESTLIGTSLMGTLYIIRRGERVLRAGFTDNWIL